MKKSFALAYYSCIILRVKAQQSNITVTQNDPNWKAIPNLYVSPMLALDIPFSNEGLNASALGWGIRSNVIIADRFMADVNVMTGFWNIISDVDKKPRLIEIGGVYMVKNSVREKNMRVVTSRNQLFSERSGDEINTTEQINFINVPNGKQMRFSGVRGGLYTFRSIFDYSVPGIPPEGTNYNTPDEDVTGWTNAVGAYLGWTFGSVVNLHVNKGSRSYSEMKYNRWFADLLLAGYGHQYIQNYPTNDKTALPIGFRLGLESTNKTNSGAIAQTIHAEIGYRPGFNGFYTSMSFSFLQFRAKINALHKSES